MLKAKSEVARRVGAWAPALDFPKRNNVSPGMLPPNDIPSIHDMYSTYPMYSWLPYGIYLLIQGRLPNRTAI